MITRLILHNFRKYKSATFTFSKGINYIYGGNGHGKTTILEALHCLITGRSFRTPHHHELIREGEKEYYLEIHFIKNDVPQSLSLLYDGTKKRVLHNGTALQNLSALFGILRGVILLPEDEMLIKGGPACRRLYCDLNLAQVKPLYLHHLSRYGLALKQRNVLLKEKKETHLAIFEQQMALSASYLTLMRKELILALNETTKKIHNQMNQENELLELSYLSQIKETEALETHFITQFAQERKKALFLGYTQIGPHRDDLEILLSKKEAKSFASEGQKRAACATLRLAQWHYLQKQSEDPPLLCIDDIGLALDHMRTQLLYQYIEKIEGIKQLFLTSCNTPPHYLTAHLLPLI